jgi:hypothetical protein
MVAILNSQNLFPLPYWAPSLWRVPMPLHLLNEAYVGGPVERGETGASVRLPSMLLQKAIWGVALSQGPTIELEAAFANQIANQLRDTMWDSAPRNGITDEKCRTGADV